MTVHSTRAPVAEADRFVDQFAPLDGAPVVLFGLGLGLHAQALARRPDAGRIVVVEPFARLLDIARSIPATRALIDEGRIDVVADWRQFKALLGCRPLDLAAARYCCLPVYERLADAPCRTLGTLVTAAVQWARLGLEAPVKPFRRQPGLTVVVTTFNRPESAASLVRSIATQRVDVPVELLVVNDGGPRAVFDAVRAVSASFGGEIRLFDTGYAGYGLALARNVGLRHARYDVTVFLDDDMEPCADLLARYLEAPEGVRMGRIDLVFEDDYGRHVRPDRRVALRGPDRVLAPWERFAGFMWGGSCAVPTEVALAIGGFDERHLDHGEEDLDFSVRAVHATHAPVAVPSARALHAGGRTPTGIVGFESRPRSGPPGKRPGDTGEVVNGGVRYWLGDRWHRCVTG